MTKSTVAEIRARFDADVERFSNLDTGQAAIPDAPLLLELIAAVAARTTPHATSLLDIGCGAGNYSLKLLAALPSLDVTLIDLSRPMLDRALLRIGHGTAIQGDIREIDLPENGFDIIVAAMVLHHLRDAEEWRAVFGKLYRALRAGGSLWIADTIQHTDASVQELMWQRYGEYLTGLKDEAYRDHVFAYVAKEDTPRPLMFQIDLLREVGFTEVDILHKNSAFAAFGARKQRC